jgi:hypothetical protein
MLSRPRRPLTGGIVDPVEIEELFALQDSVGGIDKFQRRPQHLFMGLKQLT